MNKEDIINTIEHMRTYGCSPIMKCNECPLNHATSKIDTLICISLSYARENK